MRRALVTGANRGIGFAIASGLAAQGCEVLLGARDLTSGETAARRIGATALELDVANPDSITRALEEAGPVDILVNNAGVLGSEPLLEDPRDFEVSMAVMVHGPYQLLHHLVPQMVANGYGRVVNVSSGWACFIWSGAFSEAQATNPYGFPPVSL